MISFVLFRILMNITRIWLSLLNWNNGLSIIFICIREAFWIQSKYVSNDVDICVVHLRRYWIAQIKGSPTAEKQWGYYSYLFSYDKRIGIKTLTWYQNIWHKCLQWNSLNLINAFSVCSKIHFENNHWHLFSLLRYYPTRDSSHKQTFGRMSKYLCDIHFPIQKFELHDKLRLGHNFLKPNCF